MGLIIPRMRTSRVVFFVILVFVTTQFLSATTTAISPLPFDVRAITRNGNTLFVCGAELGIAASTDGGINWSVLNRRADGVTLLSMGWTNERFGFVGGTGGAVLITEDGGATWKDLPRTFTDPILHISFSDAQHGIVATTASVLYTKDGAKTWQTVLPSASLDLKEYSFVLAVATLDNVHAAVLLKHGPAQYYAQRLFTTQDGGGTWNSSDIEHTTLNNLLIVRNEFWLVGTEVIEREVRGGHAVSVTFRSRDAVAWERGPKPLIDTNQACRPEGCLMWNGAYFDPFVANGGVHAFSEIKSLSSQWSATDKRLCTLTPELQCVDTALVKKLPERDDAPPSPQLAASALRPRTQESAGQCIQCDYPRVLVSESFKGNAVVEVEVISRPDGSVSSVEIGKSPNVEIGEELARAAKRWLFYPVLKDANPVSARRKVKLQVTVIHQ
jgi:hypothetical protein